MAVALLAKRILMPPVRRHPNFKPRRANFQISPVAATGSGLQLPVRDHRRDDTVKAARTGHGHGSGHPDPLHRAPNAA
jgi:hypothetical protein